MPSAFSNPHATGDDAPALSPAALLRLPFVQAVRRGLARCGVGPGAGRLLAAVSGGPDSTAMLVALWALREALGLELYVCSIDHGLRGESTREADTVGEVAQRLGLAAAVVRVSVPRSASRMAAARAARYQALAEVCAAHGIGTVAVAHTLNDQSETLLQRWLGGSGLRGLAGMASRAPLPVETDAAIAVVRPLLALSRDEVCDFVGQLAPRIAPRIAPLPFLDPSNDDRRYQRARLRKEVLPLLRRESPRLDQHLAELAEQLGADAEYLEQVAAAALSDLQARAPGPRSDDLVVLPRAELLALPRPIATRVLGLSAGRSLSRRHLEALLTLCATGAGTQSLTLPGGLVAERRYDELRFARRPQTDLATGATAWPLALTAGRQRCGELTLVVELLDAEAPVGEGARAVCLPLPIAPLVVRAPRAGDRIRLPSGTRKLSDLFTDRKVPRPERNKVRVLCAGETIVWVVGHRAAARPDGESGAPPEVRPWVRISVAADQEQDLFGG